MKTVRIQREKDLWCNTEPSGAKLCGYFVMINVLFKALLGHKYGAAAQTQILCHGLNYVLPKILMDDTSQSGCTCYTNKLRRI